MLNKNRHCQGLEYFSFLHDFLFVYFWKYGQNCKNTEITGKKYLYKDFFTVTDFKHRTFFIPWVQGQNFVFWVTVDDKEISVSNKKIICRCTSTELSIFQTPFTYSATEWSIIQICFALKMHLAQKPNVRHLNAYKCV